MARLIGHRTRRDPFVRIERTVMEDAGLSFKAKALYGYLLDKGEVPGWTTDVEKICALTADGAYAIRAALVELEVAGYLVRTDSGSGGRGRRAEWHVFDEAKPAENREVSQLALIAETAIVSRGNRDAAPTHRESNKKTKKDSAAAPQKAARQHREYEDRARELVKAAWGARPVLPGVSFIGVAQLVERFLSVGRSETDVAAALLSCRAFTANAIEFELNGPRRNGARQEPTAEDWAATEREALAREATTTKGKR